MSLSSGCSKLDRQLSTVGGWLQPLLLLVIRLYWGWMFFQYGKTKLLDLNGTAGFFGSLHIPLPKLSAILAGSTECVGGLLFLAGLGSRIITLPLMFTMIIVYITTEEAALHAILSDPAKVTGARAFLFLFAVLIVFAFGPGKISLDALFFKKGAGSK
jgi:putative oxidoreductase